MSLGAKWVRSKHGPAAQALCHVIARMLLAVESSWLQTAERAAQERQQAAESRLDEARTWQQTAGQRETMLQVSLFTRPQSALTLGQASMDSLQSLHHLSTRQGR